MLNDRFSYSNDRENEVGKDHGDGEMNDKHMM